MKRFILYILLSSLFSMMLMGQNRKNVVLTFDEQDFFYREINGMLYISSKTLPTSYDIDTLAPALPFIGVKVLIDVNCDVSSITYTEHEKLIKSHIEMAPNPMLVPVDSKPIMQENRTNTYDKAIYPIQLISHRETHIMDGYKMATMKVCPFRYDVNARTLYLIDSLRITIEMNPTKIQSGTAGGNMRDIIKNLVINADEMNTLYGNNAISSLSNSKSSQDAPEYIIVTQDSLKDAFQTLANWKTTKGIKAKVLTIESINQNYTGSTQQIRIKKALKDYYDGTYSGLKYVLLGGDIQIVPTQQCYARISSRYEYNDFPTDLFYACLETMNWDTNGNEKVGEIQDSVSLEQNIFVTRIPIHNNIQVSNLVNRIVLYEQGYLSPNNGDSILMCGVKFHGFFNNISDSQICGTTLYNDFISPYWDGTKIDFYDTHTDFPGDATYDVTAEHLQTQLAKGHPFVYVSTHGFANLWTMETDGFPYRNTHADSLINNKSTLNGGVGTTNIITSACWTSAFDNNCLGEVFMRNPRSGLLTYTGCSRESWHYYNSPVLGPSDNFNAVFFETLFSGQTMRYGEVVATMKAYFCDSTDNVYRWLLYGISPMGDPEMPIFTANPLVLPKPSISYSNGVLSINTNVSGCTICLTSKHDAGNSYFEVVSNTSANSFNIPLQYKYTLCITKPGYAPYLTTIYRLPYIQNETITSDVTEVSENVWIGSDVTTSLPQGPVIIESGKTTIQVDDSVTIKNNFEVQHGAEFEIKIPE